MARKGAQDKNNQSVSTPQELFDIIDASLSLNLDAAANETNAKCERFYSEEDDALSIDWEVGARVWLNPPYRNVGTWMEKAGFEAYARCELVACLIPASVGSRWWYNHVSRYASDITFLVGRVKFVGYGNSPMYDCALVVYHMVGMRLQQIRPNITWWDWKSGEKYPGLIERK